MGKITPPVVSREQERWELEVAPSFIVGEDDDGRAKTGLKPG